MDIRKLQRVIVDGLEDVKAQHIVVFNTEHLSALFERVIIASGTSSRQTKSLAASVRDVVKGAGFAVPRTEGEGNGEWIIVDCGAAVVHVMQPSIREYYHLEEIWGDKPVNMKIESGVRKLVKAAEPEKAPAKKAVTKAVATKKVAGKKAVAKTVAVKTVPAKTVPVKKTAPAAKKTVTRTTGVKRAAPKTIVIGSPAPKKTAARKVAAKKAPARKAPRPLGVKLLLVAVGQRQPAWADAAYADFAKRFPPEMRLELKTVKAETRGSKTAGQLMAAEAARIEQALPRGARRIVLDEHGDRLTTVQLAARLTAWQGDGRDAALIVGGPDGLAAELKSTADETLRLSDLTLPHAFVRVLLAEALYRAWTVTINHPYHRD